MANTDFLLARCRRDNTAQIDWIAPANQKVAFSYVSVFCTGKWFLFRHLFFRVIRCVALLRLPLRGAFGKVEKMQSRRQRKKKNAAQTLRAPRRCVRFVATSLVSSTHSSPPLCPVRTAKSSLSVKGTPPRALHATISRPSRSFASRSRTSVFSRHPSSQCIPAVTKTQIAQNIALGQRTRNQAMVRGPGPVASHRADDFDVVTLSQ